MNIDDGFILALLNKAANIAKNNTPLKSMYTVYLCARGKMMLSVVFLSHDDIAKWHGRVVCAPGLYVVVLTLKSDRIILDLLFS